MAKIDFKIGQLQVSIEGEAEFVSDQFSLIERRISDYATVAGAFVIADAVNLPEERVAEAVELNIEVDKMQSSTTSGSYSAESDLPDAFADWRSRLPKDVKNTDLVLVGGYYAQRFSSDNVFRVRDVSNLFKDHDIDIRNISQTLKSGLRRKMITPNGSKGRESYYEFTKKGDTHLKKLLQIS